MPAEKKHPENSHLILSLRAVLRIWRDAVGKGMAQGLASSCFLKSEAAILSQVLKGLPEPMA